MIIFRCVNVRYAIQIDFLLLSTALNNHVLERKKYGRVVKKSEVLEEFNKLHRRQLPVLRFKCLMV